MHVDAPRGHFPDEKSFGPGPLSRDGLDRLRAWAILSFGAGMMVAIVRLATPFEHGIWLVAYILLVGFLAPLIMATGQAALVDGRVEAPKTDRQALLWALGTILVPIGVFAEARLAVMLGGGALWIALATLTTVAIERLKERRRLGLAWAQLCAVGILSVSTGIGILLAWDSP